MRLPTIALAALLLATLVGAAPGQSSFVSADGQPLPKTLLRYKDAPPKAGRTLLDTAPWKVWSAVEGYRPRYGPAADAPPVPGSQLKLWQPAFVAQVHEDPASGRWRYLLAKSQSPPAISEFVGWVDGPALLTYVTPLTADDSGIYRKAMIVQTVTTVGGGGDVAAVPITPAPVAWDKLTPQQQQASVSYNLFNVYFVYGETANHLLIGVDDGFDSGAGPAGKVKGWLDKNYAALWNSRLALEWDRDSTVASAKLRRTQPGYVLETRDDALRYMSSVVDPDPKWIVFQEEIDSQTGISRGFRPDEMRLPILESPTRDVRSQNYLAKIGGIGGSKVDNARVDLIRRQIDSLQQRLNQIDILFVVDDTTSMGQYFPRVAEAVQAIQSSVQAAGALPAAKGRSIRVAVSYYGDVAASKQPFKTSSLKNVADAKSMQLIVDELSGYDELGNWKPADQRPANAHPTQGGGDAPESVFAGLNKAIDDARFRPFGQKLVILLGDMGDKSGVDGAEKAPTAELLKRLFPEKEDSLQFYAVHVGSAESRAQPSSEHFARQMQGVAAAYRTRLQAAFAIDATQGDIAGLAQYVSGDVPANVGTILTKRFERMEAETLQLQTDLRTVLLGERSNTVIGESTRLRLLQAGLDPNQVARIKQIFREGFVWINARQPRGVPQVRQMAWLEEDRIVELESLLGRLLGPQAGVRGANIHTVVQEAIKDLAGQGTVPESQTLNKVFFERFGIPVKSEIMRRTPVELRAGIRPEWLRDLRLRWLRLQDLLAGRHNDWTFREMRDDSGELVYTPVSKPREVAPEIRGLPRYDKIAGDPLGRRWYWVDVDEELP